MPIGSIQGRAGARAIVLTSCLAFLGCTSLAPIPLDDARVQLRAGDVVRIERIDDRIATLEVVAVAEDGLVGRPPGSESAGTEVAVPYREVRAIERREHSAVKTTALVVGATLLVWFAFGLTIEPDGGPAAASRR